MRKAAGPRVGRRREHVLAFCIVQRIVKPGNGPGGVTKSRVCGDILHPLSIDIHFTPVSKTGEIFRTGEGAAASSNSILRIHDSVSGLGSSPSKTLAGTAVKSIKREPRRGDPRSQSVTRRPQLTASSSLAREYQFSPSGSTQRRRRRMNELSIIDKQNARCGRRFRILRSGRMAEKTGIAAILPP